MSEIKQLEDAIVELVARMTSLEKRFDDFSHIDQMWSDKIANRIGSHENVLERLANTANLGNMVLVCTLQHMGVGKKEAMKLFDRAGDTLEELMREGEEGINVAFDKTYAIRKEDL